MRKRKSRWRRILILEDLTGIFLLVVFILIVVAVIVVAPT